MNKEDLYNSVFEKNEYKNNVKKKMSFGDIFITTFLILGGLYFIASVIKSDFLWNLIK
jgi:hypothetical protein